MLDLDELESARLLHDASDDAETLDRSILATAVIHCHEYRQFLLECLRLILKLSTDLDTDEDTRNVLRQLIDLILETKDGPARNGSLYAQKCMTAMSGVEKSLYSLAERVQSSLTLGQTSTYEHDEITTLQQLSLGQEHESLGAILTHLVKSNYTGVEDFHKILEHLPTVDRWNTLAAHYAPVLAAFTAQYGSPEGSGSLREARLLHNKIVVSKDTAPWALRNFQAAMISWWLAEYSGWYLDQPLGSPVQGVNLEAESQARSESFFQALRDGAFQCTLSLCSQIRPNDWHDPARNSLTALLLHETTSLPHEASLMSSYFQDLIMEQIEIFADAFITNMPDTLRRFQVEEDDQRIKLLSSLKPGVPSSVSEHDLHLERFMVIISYAFEHRTDAAQSFWADTESNLYGFLQWASKRQSTPRVGAFCEMLRGISEGENCATFAHNFLCEEGGFTSAKIRRSSPLAWAQIFAELDLYTSRIREYPTANLAAGQYIVKGQADDIDEPESAIMLETYLRLMSHVCRESTLARSWVLHHPTFRAMEVLLLLCSSAVPSRLRACAFAAVQALSTNKTVELGSSLWISLDQWVSGGSLLPPSSLKPAKVSNASAWAEATFNSMANEFEETNEFIRLLQVLVSPVADGPGLNDALPFPEWLGSTYRMPGIEPYIDFVLGKVFAIKMQELEGSPQLRILRWNVLNFIATCLGTFNEDLVILANRTTIAVDTAMNTSSLMAYVRFHPFSRVMEWMFNERVLAALFASAHQDITEISRSLPDSPLVLALLRSIDVMNLIMDLQSTYLDIARPLVKTQSSAYRKPVHSPSLASFEDSVAKNLGLIVDLGLYSGTGIQDLAISSIKLLQKFASSRKLNVQPLQGQAQSFSGNRLIGVLQQEEDLERIARPLILAMQFDTRELVQGPDSPGWVIKSVVLDFLNDCLAVSPNRPNLAHALLGFSCTGAGLDVEADGLFARSSSLFHAILRLVVEYPDGDETTMLSWALDLKQKGLQVLSTLWTSHLTSIFTLVELRASDFLFALFISQKPIEVSTGWDGQSVKDSEFISTSSAVAFEHYLQQRRLLIEYTSSELRLVSLEGAPSLQGRILSTLLGSTTMPTGEAVPNLTIFDLFDFAEVDFAQDATPPATNYFSGMDFSVSTGLGLDDIVHGYDLRMVEEMLALRHNELRKSGLMKDPTEEQVANTEAENLILYFHGQNIRHSLAFARVQTLKAWVDLMTLVVVKCDLDQGTRSTLTLQGLQVITPKLDQYALENTSDAVELACLVRTLLFQLNFNSSTLDKARAGDVAHDRLFQVFRTALRAISISDGNPLIREVLYNICHRYLTGMAEILDAPLRRQHNTQTIKATGERLIDIVCDDAYGGAGTCRVSALLLLNSLVLLAKSESSTYLVNSLVRTNFIVVIVEAIKDIPQELRETSARGKVLWIRLSMLEIKAYMESEW